MEKEQTNIGFLVESNLDNVRPVGWREVCIFKEMEEAQKWLRQGFVSDEEYRVARVEFKKRDCCGAKYDVKVTERWTVKEFISFRRVVPRPAFQPPDSCSKCIASVPFGKDGHHLH